jgi:cytochrome c
MFVTHVSSRTRSFATLALAAVALVAAAALWHPAPVAAAQDSDPGSIAYYNQKVKPIFDANCTRCHGGMNHRGGLNIDTKAGMLKGGHDGAVLVPGHPEQSLLVKLIRHEGPADDPMPMPPAPRAKISDAEIAVVSAWVKAGAPMPDAPQ